MTINIGSSGEDRAYRDPGAHVQPSAQTSLADEVTLFAAGSLQAAFSDVAADYSATSGTAVAMNFGPSGLMRERIEAGETAHIFVSANMGHAKALERAGRGGQVAAFVRNHLCVLARPEVSICPATLIDVMLSPDTRIGTSTPKADPSGDDAFALFGKSAYGSTLRRKARQLTGGPDSAEPPKGRNTYAWVLDSNQADVFLTYRTNALLAQREVPDLQIVPLPKAWSVGADYGLIVLDGAPDSAKAFALHIQSPAGRSVLADYGFDVATVSKEK